MHENPVLAITEGPLSGNLWEITEEELTIGRESSCQIVLPIGKVSRRHVMIRREYGRYYLTDLNSTNGTLLNGKPVTDKTILQNGYEIVLGNAAKLVFIGDDPYMKSLLSQEDINNICRQPNLLVRNLQITQGYHQVALALDQFIGGDDVNWFAFGTYASKTAGRAIRHETLPGPLKSALIRGAGYDNTLLYLHYVLVEAAGNDEAQINNLLAEVLSQVSLLLSKGNLLIFQELAWPFCDMIAQFHETEQRDADRWYHFLNNHFRPGSFDEGGQDWLRESLTSFYLARFTTDKKRQSELILRGNILLGLHEQSRLQPVIEKTLAVPFDLFTKGIIPDDNVAGQSRLDRLGRRAIGFSRNMVLRTVTRMWMTYSLPHREMKLGEDIIAPTGMLNFPPTLLQIEDPRCRELIARYDFATSTLTGSAADNWAQLDDRMRYIVDFFRSYQGYKNLYQPPFLDSQVKVIKSGYFPGGTL